jgi:hypothetical protein
MSKRMNRDSSIISIKTVLIVVAVLSVLPKLTKWIGEGGPVNENTLAKNAVNKKTVFNVDEYNIFQLKNGPKIKLPKSKYYELKIQTNKYRKSVMTKVNSKKSFDETNLGKEELKVLLFISSEEMISYTRAGMIRRFTYLEHELNKMGVKNKLAAYVVKTNFSNMVGHLMTDSIFESFNPTDGSKYPINSNLTIRVLEPYGQPDTVMNHFKGMFSMLNKYAAPPFNKYNSSKTDIWVFLNSKNRVVSVFTHSNTHNGEPVSEVFDKEYFVTPSATVLAMNASKHFGIDRKFLSEFWTAPATPSDIKTHTHDLAKGNIDFINFASELTSPKLLNKVREKATRQLNDGLDEIKN